MSFFLRVYVIKFYSTINGTIGLFMQSESTHGLDVLGTLVVDDDVVVLIAVVVVDITVVVVVLVIMLVDDIG